VRSVAPTAEVEATGKVIFATSMSWTGSSRRRTLARSRRRDGGQRLYEWAMSGDRRRRRYLQEAAGGLGAVITGRTTDDPPVPW
jgi:hypothetical protein